MAYLMTHSLLASWLYLMKDNAFEDATTVKEPFEDFLRTLRREPSQPTAAMQNGIDFEDMVNAIVTSSPTKPLGYDAKWEEAAQQVARILDGAQLQYRAKKLIRCHDMDFLLYGRLDALKAGVIYDIKFSKAYDKGKFLNSTQHPVYFELIPEAEEFTYLISNGQYVWTETYHREETRERFPINACISDFIDWLKAVDMLEIYKEYWKSL